MSGRTFGSLTRDGEAWVIADLAPHVAIKLKAIFPKVPKESVGPFRIAATPDAAADIDWFCARYPLATPVDAARDLARDKAGYEAVQAEVGRIIAGDFAPPNLGRLREGQELRSHQAQAVALLSRLGGLLVGDEVGEGKTYTGAAACLTPGALPACVVAPPHLAGQWKTKVEAFTTLRCHVIRGTRPYLLPPCDVRIFSYTNLAGWVDYLPMLGTGLVVYDETHELRRGLEAAKGRGAEALSAAARMRLALTATPVFNYGGEIHAIMSFVRPEVLGDWEDFAREWGAGRDGRGLRIKDPKALGAYLREQNAFIRKEGKGPPANVLIETVDCDAEALADVEALAQTLARRATSGTFHERGQATRELDLLMRQATGVAKAPAVAAYARMLAEAGEPLILFGWHREVYDIWLEALADLKPAMFTGSETRPQKEASKQRFLSGETNIFIMSLRSGAGLDGLQARAATVVFGELDWSPQMHAQCVGRLNREGQARWDVGGRVDVIYLVAEDGSDPPMQEVLGVKAAQAHGVVDPFAGAQVVERDESALQRLVARYLERATAGRAAA